MGALCDDAELLRALGLSDCLSPRASGANAVLGEASGAPSVPFGSPNDRDDAKAAVPTPSPLTSERQAMSPDDRLAPLQPPPAPTIGPKVPPVTLSVSDGVSGSWRRTGV